MQTPNAKAKTTSGSNSKSESKSQPRTSKHKRHGEDQKLTSYKLYSNQLTARLGLSLGENLLDLLQGLLGTGNDGAVVDGVRARDGDLADHHDVLHLPCAGEGLVDLVKDLLRAASDPHANLLGPLLRFLESLGLPARANGGRRER